MKIIPFAVLSVRFKAVGRRRVPQSADGTRSVPATGVVSTARIGQSPSRSKALPARTFHSLVGDHSPATLKKCRSWTVPRKAMKKIDTLRLHIKTRVVELSVDCFAKSGQRWIGDRENEENTCLSGLDASGGRCRRLPVVGLPAPRIAHARPDRAVLLQPRCDLRFVRLVRKPRSFLRQPVQFCGSSAVLAAAQHRSLAAQRQSWRCPARKPTAPRASALIRYAIKRSRTLRIAAATRVYFVSTPRGSGIRRLRTRRGTNQLDGFGCSIGRAHPMASALRAPP